MSVISPLLKNWLDAGLIQGVDWDYFMHAKRIPITLAAGQEMGILENVPQMYAPIGSVFYFTAVFTHPRCGVRWETINLETGDNIRPEILSMGFPGLFSSSYFGGLVFLAGVPTNLYNIYVVKEHIWQQWSKFYLFNASASQQICIGYGFMGARLLRLGAKKLGLPEELWKEAEV